jgi:hypothetical protein
MQFNIFNYTIISINLKVVLLPAVSRHKTDKLIKTGMFSTLPLVALLMLLIE